MSATADDLISDIPLEAWRIGNGASAPAQNGVQSDAELYYRRAIALFPGDATAHNNLGVLRQMQGRTADSVTQYRYALAQDPATSTARRNLALLLLLTGHRDDALPLFHKEVTDGTDGVRWLSERVSAAMRERDLRVAGELAAILATLRWGSKFFPRGRSLPVSPQPPRAFVTLAKLRHDVEQFDYLKRQGLFGEELDPILDAYRQMIEQIASHGGDGHFPPHAEAQAALGDTYNRILHVRHTPRVEQVFSRDWNPRAVERAYLAGALGLVVVDDLLSKEALEEVRRFCLESTVWSGIRYVHGRLGAFFYDGFNCPLLLQIAERLRRDLPNLIGERHPLRQLWGFKNTQPLPADSTNHADFAAVSVNLWITPDDANLAPGTGGLVVYDLDAPPSWDFDQYNANPDSIRDLLQNKGARRLTIPYRQNRAIIFNSDLFHATDAVTFRPGYENFRINITMLYGEREDDEHHPNLVGEQNPAAYLAWRSRAFARVRGG